MGTGVSTLGSDYRNHAVGCEDEYDHPGSCRPFGETLMPNDRMSDHDVPIRDLPFVKIKGHPTNPSLDTPIVHIEGPTMDWSGLAKDLSVDILLAIGAANTLCGRTFSMHTYYYPQSWFHAPRWTQWTTCKTCWRVHVEGKG